MVEVHWCALEREIDPAWGSTQALYADATPNSRELRYIDKADFCTIRERWNASDQQSFGRALECARRIDDHVVSDRSIHLPLGSRLTSQLLSDIESLLLHVLEPRGSIPCSQSRLCGLGMTINARASGLWLSASSAMGRFLLSCRRREAATH